VVANQIFIQHDEYNECLFYHIIMGLTLTKEGDVSNEFMYIGETGASFPIPRQNANQSKIKIKVEKYLKSR